MLKVFLYLMALLYVAAGINHFVHPATYLRIMPAYIPYHETLVKISGVLEILCGALLLFPQTRIAGAWLTIALLIAVFPANIEMAVSWHRSHHPYYWIALLRLPLQLLLIWWAWLYTKQLR